MASLALLIIATLVGISEEIAVMSIDLGSEWMKVAIVSVRDCPFPTAACPADFLDRWFRVREQVRRVR